MFRRTEQDTDEAPVRDEHAYEDNWYRSLKALAEHRATEEETDHEAPGAETGGGEAEEPGSEAENPADVGLARDGAPAVGSEDAPDGPEAVQGEAGLPPGDGLPTATEPDVQAQGPHVAWPGAETSQPTEPGAALPAPGPSEVEELTVRTDHIIERLRTLRDADGPEPSLADEAGRVDSADAPPGHEELGTRAQQLLERLRTLRTLNDAEGRGSEPQDPQAWG